MKLKPSKSKSAKTETYTIQTGRFVLRPRIDMNRYEVIIEKKRGQKVAS